MTTAAHYSPLPTDLWTAPPSQTLRVEPGFDLAAFDRAGTPGWSGSKKDAARAMATYAAALDPLQECLYANGKSGGHDSVLLVVQGLDTAGKGGILRHVVGMVDPQGVQIRNFGVPTAIEAAHHHLWRIERETPRFGMIGVFDRSHYEQVLVVKVAGLEPASVTETRYGELLDFDRRMASAGTQVIKVALMVSYPEQQRRLLRRLERADKHWKFNPSDIDVRHRWDDYQEAYRLMFERTSTPDAPWYVIPADHKWFARLAVTHLLWEHLTGLDLAWPAAGFDVEAEKARLAATSR